MRYNLLGTADHWFPGQQAIGVDKLDWACLSTSPFAERIPGILKEAHALFHVDKEAKRLAEKNSFIAARPLGGSDEANTRRDALAACALGDYQIADTDGNWIDITDD